MSQNKTTDMSFVQKTKKDVWQTPQSLWKPIAENTDGGIDVDPCAGPNTNIGDTNYTVADDGLSQDWFGTVWLNPPFSQKDEWMKKAKYQYRIGNVDTIYIVTPDSTDVQSWWHNRLATFCEHVWFSDGRINYIDPETGEQSNGVPFGTAINICGNINNDIQEVLSESGDLMRRI